LPAENEIVICPQTKWEVGLPGLAESLGTLQHSNITAALTVNPPFPMSFFPDRVREDAVPHIIGIVYCIKVNVVAILVTEDVKRSLE